MGKTWLAIAGFKNGKGPWAQELRQSPEAGKGKKTDSCLEPSRKETSHANILTHSSMRPTLDFSAPEL